MAEVNVVKKTSPEEKGLGSFFGFEAPLFKGSLFNVNPFALMRKFSEDMDKTFGPKMAGFAKEGTWLPTLEVKEEKGKLLVTAELPGLKKEDIKVNVTENLLEFEGERKQEKEEKREGYFHSERSYGKFYRSLALPEGAKADQITANFNNGILEIIVPIPEVMPKAAKQIPVQEGAATKAPVH